MNRHSSNVCAGYILFAARTFGTGMLTFASDSYAQERATGQVASDKPIDKTLPLRAVTAAFDEQNFRIGTSYHDVVDRSVAAKLRTGLVTTIATRFYMVRERDNQPVTVSVRTCRISYDVWDEVFRVRIAAGGAERDLAAVSTEGVLRLCAEVKDFPIAQRTLLTKGESYYVGVVSEVNPMSAENLEAMRRWVTRPPGATRLSSSDALFGSFVGLFVRPSTAAERDLRYRSQAVVVPY